MKKLWFFVLVCIYAQANAQITLEHAYDSASYLSQQNQLMQIDFEYSGELWVNINRIGKYISFYNLNHELLKIIDGDFFTDYPYIFDILYISQNLFNTDSLIEFMFVEYSPYRTTIYNENKVILFSDSGVPIIRANMPPQQLPIYNTNQGSKMVLSYENGHAKVFSLPGTLSLGIQEANGYLMQQNGTFSNLYPNPGNGQVTIEYDLPKNVPEGELVLYDMQGKEVKRYKVDNTFNDLIIDNTQLPAGTYLYQLQTSSGPVGTKKMVIVK